MEQTILIPDVHGRPFWRDAIPYVDAGASCIFLGDYSDPYGFEGISIADTIANFRDIVAFARRYSERVLLLLGNHDLSYFGTGTKPWGIRTDRYSYSYADSWHTLYSDNADLFGLCTCRQAGGRPVLISHAGLHPVWVEASGLFPDVDRSDPQALARRVDELYRDSLAAVERTPFIEALADISPFRGGSKETGSMVWADCREFASVPSSPFMQIFGHTAQWSDGFHRAMNPPCRIGDNICIDCACCYSLDALLE